LKIHNEKNIESHPLNEGFIMVPDDHPKPSKKITVKPDKRIFISNNISSTTCRTVVIVKTKKQTSPPILDHSMGHHGRRLLNEPSYDTDLDITSKPTPIDEEFDSFLKVNDEELSKQLLNMDAAMDGSGISTFRAKHSFPIKKIPFFCFTATEDTTQQTTSKLDRMITGLTQIELILVSSTTTKAPRKERPSNLPI
jgi:hypothetical protein